MAGVLEIVWGFDGFFRRRGSEGAREREATVTAEFETETEHSDHKFLCSSSQSHEQDFCFLFWVKVESVVW